MKKATLEATDENILQSIKEQKGTERNTEIMEFIKALDLIEENIFISLDARWGEGKTFYVRQIEKTLEYQTLKNFETDDNKNKYEEMKPYFEKTVLEDIELGNSYLPEALESANLATGTFRRDLKSQCKKLCGAIKDNR